jgi:hypothetical protein
LGGWARVRASRRVLELLERQDRARLTHNEPSRSASNGRLAAAGSSVRRDRARIAAKLAILVRAIAASVPPQSISSAEPDRIEGVPDHHLRGLSITLSSRLTPAAVSVSADVGLGAGYQLTPSR